MQTLLQLQNGELKGAVSLKLSEGLSHFPEEIFDLAETLEVLDLSQNRLSTLPAHFGKLKKLRILFCSDNLFAVLPAVLAHCPLLDIVGFKANQIAVVPPESLNPNIRWLILTNNKIVKLPPTIGNCLRMQKLMLAGNQLTELPIELKQCSKLGLLRIAANRLNALPGWLLSMPKLSWLAFSGNPFSKSIDVPVLDVVAWHELEVTQLLGEGASGVISKAIWRGGNDATEVAVKVFKGAVTSDGLPEDEMNACIAAGPHPGLVQLIGQISAHPQGKKGLVLGLIPPSFYNLGLTPSFESCTRDVFAADMRLSVAQVVKIAQTIASVAAQLHSKGIMHSDLYAHNILIDNEGNALFGDFGAASFYDTADSETALALERLEVSAFGCLLEDMLNLCNDMEHDAIIKLDEIKTLCFAHNVLARPGFNWLAAQLAKL